MTLAMTNPLTVVAGALVLLGTLPAQTGASSLSALVERADVVVQAHTSGVPSGNAAVHVFQFHTELNLKGTAAPVFQVAEPAGRCCGRALAGLAPGSYVLFLVSSNGAWKLAVSGARSVVAADQHLVQHLEDLIAAGDPVDRVSVIASALTSSSSRVREDAALALPYMRDLQAAGADARAAIAATLRRDLAGSGPDLGLLIAAERMSLTPVLDDLLSSYMDGRHPHLRVAMLRAIPRIDGDEAARRVGGALPDSPLGRVRAAQLLRELPADSARQPLLDLLRGATDTAAARAGEALLHHGATADWVESQTLPVVMSAIKRLQVHRLRSRSDVRSLPR